MSETFDSEQEQPEPEHAPAIADEQFDAPILVADDTPVDDDHMDMTVV